MGEQGILNLWLQHHGVEPCELLPEFNVFRHRPGAAQASIVHAVGHHKPWMDFADPAWNADYVHWLALGGSPCPVWKPVRFMAGRHPHPARTRASYVRVPRRYCAFSCGADRCSRMARAGAQPASARGHPRRSVPLARAPWRSHWRYARESVAVRVASGRISASTVRRSCSASALCRSKTAQRYAISSRSTRVAASRGLREEVREHCLVLRRRIQPVA